VATENVEIVRQVYEAAARGDREAVFALYDRDIEWDASRTERGAVTGRVVQGHEALLRWLREWYEAWGSVDDELEQLVDANEETVVSIMTQRGRGRSSGVEVADRLGAVWTIREGKVVRVAWFPTPEEALEAAGLSK
jgi:ketosteroid isomerase-like protein